MHRSDEQNKREIHENQVLAALPSEDFERLLPNLEPVVLPPVEILYNFNDPITHLYFPNRNTIVSMLCTTDEKIDVEVAVTGNEGVVGLTGFLGTQQSSFQHLVQAPGSGTRLSLDVVKDEFKRA